MAIDFGNYAGSYAGRGVDLRGIGEKLSRIVDAQGEARKANIQANWNKHMEAQLGTFEDLAYKDLDQLLMPGGLFSKPFMTAGRAFLNARTHFLGGTDAEGNRIASTAGLTKKEQREMQTSPFLNPIAYKQQYDQMFASYLPQIIKKIEQYQEDRGLSAREMQLFVNNNPHLKNFLATYAPEGSPLQMAAQSYAPQGFIGGAVAGAMGSGLPELVGGTAAIRAAGAGLARYRGESDILRTALSKFEKDINPLKVQSGKAARSEWIKSAKGQKALADTLKKMKGKPDFTSKKSRKADKKRIKTAQDALKKAQENLKKTKPGVKSASKKYNQAFNKFKSLHRNPSEVTKAKFNNTELGKSLIEKAKKAGAKVNTATKSVGTATKNLTAANNKAVAKGAKSSIKYLTRYAQIHGRGQLVKLLATKLPARTAAMMGARMLAGGALTSFTGGLGTGLGLAMNAYTIYQLGLIAKNALEETGGLRRPDKMVFGGR